VGEGGLLALAAAQGVHCFIHHRISPSTPGAVEMDEAFFAGRCPGAGDFTHVT
jgi:hypothetical protein